MQPDYLRRFSVVEMAIHRVADLLPKGVQRLRFGKNRLAQSAGGKAAFHRFLDHENDFVHAYRPKARLDSPRFTVNSQGRSGETDVCRERNRTGLSTMNSQLSTVFPLLRLSYFLLLT